MDGRPRRLSPTRGGCPAQPAWPRPLRSCPPPTCATRERGAPAPFTGLALSAARPRRLHPLLVTLALRDGGRALLSSRTLPSHFPRPPLFPCPPLALPAPSSLPVPSPRTSRALLSSRALPSHFPRPPFFPCPPLVLPTPGSVGAVGVGPPDGRAECSVQRYGRALPVLDPAGGISQGTGASARVSALVLTMGTPGSFED
ncbi:uncharacterized protein LOC132322482 [Haemorhous mexicanus]|uniref:uncharacterized protein LOC132322482 n=1 Tax=Haemorhous mexicanus TaxID=30427 RepID=UPI0028BD3B5D|nr:uncharacterized protein LOC132322482 [Haemorhous mexicanus]